MKVIKTDDNILLELVEEKHVDAIFNLVDANKLILREWLPWVDNADRSFIKDFVNESQKRHLANSDHAYVIIFNNEVVGRIGIYTIDHKNKIGSIGYWIDENFQGKGITTKACKAILNYAFNFLHLNRIEIKCGTENYKSQGIPERLNFKKEGIIRQGEILNNKFIDLYLYSMISSDWQNHH